MNKEKLLQDMIDWFSQHEQANNDFMEHYGYSLNYNDEYIKKDMKTNKIKNITVNELEKLVIEELNDMTETLTDEQMSGAIIAINTMLNNLGINGSIGYKKGLGYKFIKKIN